MTWLYRSLLVLAVALLLAAAFLEVNRLGAFQAFAFTARPERPPVLAQNAPTALPGRAQSSALNAPRAGEFREGPRGRREQGFNGLELVKDLTLVTGAWLALGRLDRLVKRKRGPQRSARDQTPPR